LSGIEVFLGVHPVFAGAHFVQVPLEGLDGAVLGHHSVGLLRNKMENGYLDKITIFKNRLKK